MLLEGSALQPPNPFLPNAGGRGGRRSVQPPVLSLALVPEPTGGGPVFLSWPRVAAIGRPAEPVLPSLPRAPATGRRANPAALSSPLVLAGKEGSGRMGRLRSQKVLSPRPLRERGQGVRVGRNATRLSQPSIMTGRGAGTARRDPSLGTVHTLPCPYENRAAFRRSRATGGRSEPASSFAPRSRNQTAGGRGCSFFAPRSRRERGVGENGKTSPFINSFPLSRARGRGGRGRGPHATALASRGRADTQVRPYGGPAGVRPACSTTCPWQPSTIRRHTRPAGRPGRLAPPLNLPVPCPY